MRKLALVVRTDKGFELIYSGHRVDLGELKPVAVVEGALCQETYCLWCRDLRKKIDENREY